MSQIWAGQGVLFCLLAVACLIDLRERRIPNKLSLLMLVLGLTWHSIVPGGSGLFAQVGPGGLGFSASALGGSVAFLLLLPIYSMRLMGGGDVKLMVALGTWVGIFGLLPLVLLVLVCGGVLALTRMVDGKRLARLYTNLRIICQQVLTFPAAPPKRFDPQVDSADRLPYALAITAGVLVYAIAHYYAWLSWL